MAIFNMSCSHKNSDPQSFLVLVVVLSILPVSRGHLIHHRHQVLLFVLCQHSPCLFGYSKE